MAPESRVISKKVNVLPLLPEKEVDAHDGPWGVAGITWNRVVHSNLMVVLRVCHPGYSSVCGVKQDDFQLIKFSFDVLLCHELPYCWLCMVPLMTLRYKLPS